jgi:hypothetical protein
MGKNRKKETDSGEDLTVGARHCSMNSANRRSNPMTMMIFHQPPASRFHGLFSSRPRLSMKRCSTYVSTFRGSTSTPLNVSVSSSWSPDHLPTESDSRVS